MPEQKPSIGRIVHYVDHGDCRAAVITRLPTDDGWDQLVGLAVLGPDGLSFRRAVGRHDGGETAGSPECPDAASHGSPHRYCACGWTEAHLQDNSWHWPERVTQEITTSSTNR